MLARILSRIYSSDIGIDLGTNNILIYEKYRGILVNEPTIIVLNNATGKLVAVGAEAKTMLGRNPVDLRVVRPMRDGVISDFENVQLILGHYLTRLFRGKGRIIRPRVVIGAPTGITEVEKRALYETCESIGAREIYIIDESRAAALGAGLPVNESLGSMVVDMGGGTTEIAVLSLGGVVRSRLVRIGGDRMDEHIIRMVAQRFNLSIGQPTAENAKIKLANMARKAPRELIDITGVDASTGLPRTLRISSTDIRDAIREPMERILAGIKATLDETPPELYTDILDNGIVLTGGMSLMKGIDAYISEKLQFPVIRAENPTTAVVVGCGMFLENIHKVRDVKPRITR